MICASCSMRPPDGAVFCPACGARLDPASGSDLDRSAGEWEETRLLTARAPAAAPHANVVWGRASAHAGRTAASPHPVSDAAAPPSFPAFVPGAVVSGRYRLVSLLGRGGMGEVYRADDLLLEHPVALKFLRET